MIEIEAGGRKAQCQAGVTDTIVWAFGAFFCAIVIPIATSFATQDCDRYEHKRRTGNPRCFSSKTLGRSVCIALQLMYKLGQASSEPCNNQNHGKQKCVGNEGFITCVYSNSIEVDT
ncbi:unnamed protein product [Adineta ricciae]|uniref:Uncharacterized protein n=1 Tax=Adineta ricciae TaxID=249248 RepID=A0A815ECC3_ADIRI|nr:unnamed protein product [Adineta ricciae]CAF1309473.1 unnamed protein product [Adineta ricciae]